MAPAHPAAVVSEPDAAPLEPALVELAGACGVGTDYWDWQGRHVLVPRHTVLAVLAALGIDAQTPEAIITSLRERRLAPWRRMLPAVVVARTDRPTLVRVHVPHGAPVEVWAELEDGGDRRDLVQQEVWVDPCEVDGCLVGEATFAVPSELPLGWHRLRARSGADEADCPLIMTPAAVGLPAPMRHRRTWGFMTQLYSVRSTRSWGLGDLADLAELAGRSGAELGAGFVLVNPLHAAEPVAPMEPSPYLPTTRRFVNPVYVRVEDVPEWAYLDGPARVAVDRLAAAARVPPGSDRERDLLDRDAVWAAKAAALTLVHALPRSWARQQAYECFRAREGQGLVDFATWCALAERHGSRTSAWPVELHDPTGPAVAAFRDRCASRVDFYCWLQWVLDDQLGAAAAAARAAGMPAGLVLDLAVGVHRDGADAWIHREVLAEGVSVGAPPDAFNQQGQDWSQPPWRPDRLAQAGYAPYRDLLRTVLRHASGIRVDHVMGLFRLWWVPDGHPPSEGTYVRADYEAMVGILALEAVRAGAFVVGEDLGTVEPWVRDYLCERGILGTSVLWFERDDSGEPRRPEQWRELCLATVTTHDLPPTAGYLTGEHVRLRERLGLLTRPVEEEAAVDAADRDRWLQLLISLGLLRPGAEPDQVVEALHRALAWTPARLVGVSLADAAGETRTLNQPGTSDEYPNWRLPLADGSGRPVHLEELLDSARAAALARAVSA